MVVRSRMPRVFVRKTDKDQVPREVMERAIQAVKEGMPVRKAAKTSSIARTKLNNNLVRAKKDSTAKFEPNYKHSQIFNQEQETSLANYLEKCSGMFHGLTTKNVRTLAYEMACLNRIERWQFDSQRHAPSLDRHGDCFQQGNGWCVLQHSPLLPRDYRSLW